MKKILIIDPAADDLDLLKEILEEAGHTVLATGKLENGLEIIRDGVPVDMVLISTYYEMKYHSDAVAVLREKAATRLLPIVAVLNTNIEQEKKETLAKGYQNVVGKPIDEDEVLAVVRAVFAVGE